MSKSGTTLGGTPDLPSLQQALEACDDAALEAYLKAGLDPDALLPGGVTPVIHLINSAQQANWGDLARLLLQHGADPKVRSARGVPLLSLLVMAGAPHLVALALDLGADLEQRGPNGETPLLTAVHYRQVECVRILLERGACSTTSSDDGTSVLLWAAGRSNGLGLQRSLTCVKLLLSHGADPEVANRRGYTPLMAAALIGEVETVRALLTHGAKTEARDARGETALMKATQADCRDVVRVLLSHGADPNARNSCGGCALHSASSPDVVDELLRSGADPNLASSSGGTALHVLAAHNKPQPLQILLDNGARVDSSDEHGTTPLQIALRCRSREAANLLLDKGADPHHVDSWGTSVLLEALLPLDYYGTHNVIQKLDTPSLRAELKFSVLNPDTGRVHLLQLVQRLLQAGVDPAGARPGSTEGGDVTPAMITAAAGDLETLRLFFKKGTDPLQEDSCGRGLLSYAARWGHARVVRYLMSLECPPNKLDAFGNLPIYYAAQGGYDDVLLLLVLHFAFYMCSCVTLNT
ncbi:uncharacterized protein LOC143036750 [Oratosquilla oratoria]|uniref:uncharacterized protein LOC143036750 n=1 Tax=Oratosquilla oratoria TaxID=337810 RepID=UPI003F7689EA